MMPVVAAGLALAGSAYYLGGAAGLTHLLLYVVATLPGWPIGRLAFGRHAAAWMTGALLGYALTCLALSVGVRLGLDSPAGLGLAWLLTNIATWSLLLLRRTSPIVALPAWARRDTRALVFVGLIALALMVGVFRNIGAVDDSGARQYRAYFTADFVWHVALTNELARFQYPPTNPYAAPDALHYYWSYFMVPSVSVAFVQPAAGAVESVLLVNAVCAGLTFVAMLFLSVWAAVPRPYVAAAAVLLALLAASAEGIWILWGLWRTGGPLAALRDMNIDAMTMWRLRGLTIDGLPRSLWYVPQHAGACALGLIALVIAASARRSAGVASASVAGLALGLAVTFSPFPGGVLAVAYGLGVIFVCLGHPRDMLRPVLAQSAAVAIAAIGVIWVVTSGMVEGAGGAVQFGLLGLARHAPVATILLALGPLLIPGLLGVLAARRNVSVRPAMAGLLIGLPAFFLISVAGDPVWAGWRAGQIMLISLPPLAAATIAWLHDRGGRAAAGAFVAVLLVAGLPTTVIDAYNAQDVSNRAMGPGFRWTVLVTPDQQAAFAWLRSATRPTALVQADPVVRGRETWTLLQSFAGRRAAGGQPISLLHTARYDERSNQAHLVFETPDPRLAWETANALKIDYLYLDSTERAGLPPAGVEKFFAAPQLFPVTFTRGPVVVFGVARR